MALPDCLLIGQKVKDELLDIQKASHDEARYTQKERAQIKDMLKYLGTLANPDQLNPTDQWQAQAFAQIEPKS